MLCKEKIQIYKNIKHRPFINPCSCHLLGTATSYAGYFGHHITEILVKWFPKGEAFQSISYPNIGDLVSLV